MRLLLPLLGTLVLGPIVQAQSPQFTLTQIVEQVASYMLQEGDWTDYRRTRERQAILDRIAGATVSLTVVVGPADLRFSQGTNETSMRLEQTAYSWAIAPSQEEARQRAQVRSALDRELGQFAGSSSRPAPSPSASYEEVATSSHLLRTHNRGRLPDLMFNSSVFQMLIARRVSQFAVEVIVKSPTDRLMMETEGVRPLRILGRVTSLSWLPQGLVCEVQELSSTRIDGPSLAPRGTSNTGQVPSRGGRGGRGGQ